MKHISTRGSILKQVRTGPVFARICTATSNGPWYRIAGFCFSLLLLPRPGVAQTMPVVIDQAKAHGALLDLDSLTKVINKMRAEMKPALPRLDLASLTKSSDKRVQKLVSRINAADTVGTTANMTVSEIMKPYRLQRRLMNRLQTNNLIEELKKSFEKGGITKNDTLLAEQVEAAADKLAERVSHMRRLLLRTVLYPSNRGGLLGMSVRNQATRYFYDGQEAFTLRRNKLLKNSIISYTGQAAKASIFTELAYDVFGPVRLAIGTLVGNTTPYATDSSAVEGEKVEDQVQRLLGGGGNLSLRFGLPVIGYQTKLVSMRLDLSPNINFDVPGLGLDTNAVAQNADLGSSFLFNIDGIQGSITLFGQIRYSKILGNSLFFQNLDRGSDHGLDLWQITGGLAFGGNVRLTANWYLGDDYINDNFKFRLGLQLVPN